MFNQLMNWMRDNKVLPQISDTERQALEAGDVWIDGQFFGGKVDFEKILAEHYDTLPAHEQAFLDGPVEELLQMADSYELSRTRKLPDDVFKFMAENGFFAMQIAKEYGGMPMSTQAKSCIMAKVSSYSGLLSAMVVIPNSLGAAELLGHYGTDEQKNYYLPKLAKGEFMPCFGLTEPTAGSDAASIKAEGVVFKDSDGQIKFKLNFRKRYITLAPVANLVSLAVRLHDPDNLLGKGEEPGITVVLIEKGAPGTEGLHIGDHHQPIGEHFPNGPIVGRDVIVPAGNVLGGVEYTGMGWKMLMEALAGGRMVSLPATGICGIRHGAMIAGAYSMVRQQFGIPVGRMEGVEHKIGKAAGMTYAFDAARVFGCSAVDHGIQPPVTSAIMKAYSTEMGRDTGTDAMDVTAGYGVMQGPNNTMGRLYNSAPVSVTVEGANIMTRTLMIFGQGATRCHPYAYKVVQAVENNDVGAFRKNLTGWMVQFLLGFVMTLVRGVTRGFFTVKVPSVAPQTRSIYRRLGWAATRFGLLTNLAMFFVGGKLKARGNLTGRYADVVAWLYITTSALRRFEAEGRKAEDLALVQYAGEYGLAQIQNAFEGIYENFDGPVGVILKTVGRVWLGLNPLAKLPNDQLSHQAALALQSYGDQYKRLVGGNYMPPESDQGLGRLLKAFRLTTEAEPVREKIRAAQKARKLGRGKIDQVAADAAAQGVITDAELALLNDATAACLQAIEVDVFTKDEYYGAGGIPAMSATGDGGMEQPPAYELAKASGE
ncbi:acyl-CoA dehydrogenase [Alcanivorax hongdengensis A-11-3]|uniref:Acyl-coenzyme A dehydrogenase n=1 Tax=Alcanivorax hongdengensis A-11-3 TaxID=1177179 RepID=L0WG48_9GAMM|nr:acyl-CoA dehydrogenase [Alcanivorax hongdengensis]EKF75976.1 acyl-CoA dehydrogenase [Alcanivorax hongdengensis A-11-3]